MKKLLILSTMLLIFNNMNAQTKTSNNNCATISGNYAGTSQMGNSNGTAKLLINTNCTATLTYNQGSMGGATETGKIIKIKESYKFKADHGSQYDLIFTDKKVVLESINWKCIMSK
jgi:hypothetical protein